MMETNQPTNQPTLRQKNGRQKAIQLISSLKTPVAARRRQSQLRNWGFSALTRLWLNPSVDRQKCVWSDVPEFLLNNWWQGKKNKTLGRFQGWWQKVFLTEWTICDRAGGCGHLNPFQISCYAENAKLNLRFKRSFNGIGLHLRQPKASSITR